MVEPDPTNTVLWVRWFDELEASRSYLVQEASYSNPWHEVSLAEDPYGDYTASTLVRDTW